MNDYKLLITDLDNTLYDWVTFYAKSFECFVTKVNQITGIPLEILLDEFKLINQKYHDSEFPLAVLELPSIREKYKTISVSRILKELNPAIKAFNNKRSKTLKLYPGVYETLVEMSNSGVKIIGHTEAIYSNALLRLEKLKILKFFNSLYAVEASPLFYDGNVKKFKLKSDFLNIIPQEKRKPNPSLLIEICKAVGIEPAQAIYIGDSLVKDMSMAKEAGVKAAWAKYGTNFDKTHWNVLVRITHWTDEDVSREVQLKKHYSNVKPDITCEKFSDLLSIMSS